MTLTKADIEKIDDWIETVVKARKVREALAELKDRLGNECDKEIDECFPAFKDDKPGAKK